MTRSAAVLAVMQAEPQRCWTPAQVSAVLGCPPQQAARAIRPLFVAGALVRPEPGQYRLPPPMPPAPPVPEVTAPPAPARPSRAGQGVTSLPRDLPPLNPPPIDPALIPLVVDALRTHGRPMSQSMLINRLSGHGLKLFVLQWILAFLVANGKARRTPERLYLLVNP